MLDTLTEALRAEGTLQSEGRFTVDLLKRSRSLWNLQRREPYLWLLKLVQAAIALNAAEVHLERSAESLSVTFEPGRASVAEIHAGLQGLTGSPERGESHLIMGLVLSLGALGGTLDATLATPDGGLELHRRQGAVELLRTPPTAACSFRFCLQLPPQAWWKVWARNSEQRRLERTLQERLACCPVPVQLNNAPVPRGNLALLAGLPSASSHRDPFETVSEGFRWLMQTPRLCPTGGFLLRPTPVRASSFHICGGSRRRAEGSALSLAVLSDWSSNPVRLVDCEEGANLAFDERGKGLSLQARAEYQPDPAELYCSELLLLPLSPGRSGGLLPVLDGVALDPIPVRDAPGGAWAVLDSPDWSTDLSQLQLQQNDSVQTRLKHLQRAWSEQLEQAGNLLAVLPDLERAGLPLSVQHQWRDYLRRELN